MMNSSFTVDELLYDFADSTMSDLTLIDANNDGYNFRVYPYGGYGSGKCLKSDSYLGGANGHPLNPDNFVVLPRLIPHEGATFSFMAVDGDAVSYVDNDIQSVNCYYKVTAVNTMPGDETCESAPAMAVDGIHDYVTVQTDGINEQGGNIRVYPNPSHGQITIEAKGMSRVTVMNVLGQTIYDAPTDADQMVLDLSQYGTGMYLIRISSEMGVSVKRVSVGATFLY